MQKWRHPVYGFHLIELIITIAIISIIATFSLPAYTTYLVKERRLEAAHYLVKLAVAAQQYHLEHNGYEHMTLAALQMPEFVINHHYQLILQTAANEDYALMAKPLGAQAQADQRCGSLTLNAWGERGVTGIEAVDVCW